jgi:hypothetical protein
MSKKYEGRVRLSRRYGSHLLLIKIEERTEMIIRVKLLSMVKLQTRHSVAEFC